MNINNIQKVLAKYNLKAKEILPSQKGYRNRSYPIILDDGSKVNLVLYKNEPGIFERIKRTNLVSNFLAENGFPTRKSILLCHSGLDPESPDKHSYRDSCLRRNDILKVKLGNQIRYLSLYNYLEGSTIPWEGYTMKHIKLLGQTMAEMHKCVTRCTSYVIRFPKITDELLELNSRMKKYFSDEDVKRALREKININIDLSIFDKFEKLLFVVGKLPEQQILHMDFVRSNILFKSYDVQRTTYDVTGILDFEKTAIGPTIVDLARTLAFLIVDCKYKSEEKIRKYFLYSGYEKRGSSKIIHLKYLNSLLKFFLVYDFYKFLKHNPYDFLEQNEHFVRTRDKLLMIKIIKS